MSILEEHFKDSLVKELESLNGENFEDMCSYLIQMIDSKKSYVHKGSNTEGKGVRKAVDTKSSDCEVVAQCGTDKDYFSKKDLAKPIGDINGTIKNDPQCKLLYLFSNRRATDEQHTRLIKAIKDGKYPFAVRIVDSQKIAEIICHGRYHKLVPQILRFLPASYNVFRFLPNENSIPPQYSHYISRDKDLQHVKEMLRKVDVLQIVGTSGIGKTQFAKQIANNLTKDFQTILWIDGINYKGSLSSVRLTQYDYQINLQTIIEQYKTLVVFDNLNTEVSSLSETFSKANITGSKCVITSLSEDLANDNIYHLEHLDENLSRQLFDSFKTDATKEQKKLFLEKVDGYPLVISISCSMVKNKRITWADILSDLGSLVEIKDNERNQKIAERLVLKICESYPKAVEIIGQVNNTSIATDFLKSSMGAIAFTALLNFSILKIESFFLTSIHQVILDSINKVLKKHSLVSIVSCLCDYLCNHDQQKSIDYFTLLHYNRDFIKTVYKIANNEQRKIIIYSIFQSDDTKTNPNKYLTMLEHVQLDNFNNKYDCLLMLEKNEMDWSLLPKECIKDALEERAKFELSILPTINDEELRLDVYHHVGKIYSRISDESRMAECFNTVLKVHPHSSSTLYQIATYNHYHKKDYNEAKKYIEEIMSQDQSKVPITVLLGCYNLMSKHDYDDLANKYVFGRFEIFSQVLMASLYSFDDEAIPIMGNYAYKLQYKKPDFMQQLLEILPDPPSIDASGKMKTAYAYLKSVQYYQQEDKHSIEAMAIFNIVESLYKSVKLTDYIRKRYIELLLSAGFYGKAVDQCEQFTDKCNPYNLQDTAKAFAGIEEFDKAIAIIDKAIKNTDDADYRSSFLWNKAIFLHEKGDPTCLTVLKDAISMRKTGIPDTWKETLRGWSK